MVKNRKTIQVSESAFNEFESIKEQLGNKNSTDTLTELMQKEIIKTETTIINQNRMNNRIEVNKGDSFNSICSNYSKNLNKKEGKNE